MQEFIYNTNNQILLLGPFLNSTDGVTAMNGLTITNNDIKVLKHGATAAANKTAGNATHIIGGIYYCTVNNNDLDSYGTGMVLCNMANAIPVWHEINVIEPSKFGANNQNVNVVAMAANVLTASAFNQGAADKVWATTVRDLSSSNNIFGANAITAASFNQGAADKVWSTAARTLTANTNLGLLTAAAAAAAIWDTARASYANAGTFGEGVSSVQGNVTGTLSALAANSVTAAAFNQAAADKVWATAARTLTGAANLTSSGNALTLHTDDKVLLAGTTHTAAVIPTVSALASAGIDAIFDQASVLTLSFEELITRIYEMINNRMTVNESTGAVALRNIGNTGDIATGNVGSSSGTTTRAELSWV